MLDFILGPGKSGKTDEIYRRAKADAECGKNVFILVPDQYSLYAEKELLEKLGLKAQSKIQILTFSRLSNLILSKMGPLRTKYIDKAGKYIMACRAMQLAEKDLLFFHKNIGQSGFANLVCSLVSEFKRYGVSPQKLREFSEKTDNKTLALKLRDFSTIYKQFNDLVEENYQNAEDNLMIATGKIPECDFLTGSLYINYFQLFTPIEYKAIRMLLQKLDITVALCIDKDLKNQEAFSAQIATFNHLTALAKDLGVNTCTPLVLKQKEDCLKKEFLHLQQNFFSYRPSALKENPSSVHIIRPGNYFDEIHQCARLIRRLCRTRGYSMDDFLIITGSLSNYEFFIPSVFNEYKISFFLDQKIRISESPLMRMLLAVLEILTFGFSYERTMSILRSGFWDIDSSSVDLFENYLLAADITHKQYNGPDQWKYNPNSAFDMEEINRIREVVILPLQRLLSMFEGRKTIREISDKLLLWLKEIKLPDRVEEKIAEYKDNKNLELAQNLVRIYTSFTSVIGQLCQCMGESFATFREFYQLFTSACNELSVGVVPPAQDKVIISEASRFRSAGAKVVIVLGVIDGIFPKSYSSEGLISDSERTSLLEMGLTLAPDGYSRQKEDQYLIYSIFSTPSDDLYLFSPTCDRDGKSLGTSDVVKRISTHLFPDIKIETKDQEINNIEGEEHTFIELVSHLFDCGFDASKLSPLWQMVHKSFLKYTEYTQKLDFFHNMYRSGSEPVSITKAMAKKLYGAPLMLSVSMLERYNSCAFSFFMQYGLFARERMTGGIKATDTGTILHDVLCNYFKSKSALHTDYNKISRNDCYAEISELVDRFANTSDNLMYSQSNYYKYIFLRLKGIASATAWKLVNFYRQSSFRPTDFEVSFGKHGTLPPYTIETKDGPMQLRGFIDRIDTAEINGTKYISITDYKSSEKKLNSALIDAGITIQPFIYANAAKDGKKNAVPAAMMYLQMNDPIVSFISPPTDQQLNADISKEIKVNGLFLDNDDVILAFDPDPDNKNAVHYVSCSKDSRMHAEIFEDRLKSVEECAARTAEKMADGIIAPNPPQISGFDPCSYCPYDGICK